MKVLSLFDGISCARVALERAGIPVEAYYASEVDKYAIKISNKNYGSIVHLGSVTDIGKDRFFNELPEIDLIIGGSPCQDLSIAKKNRKGLDGERSGLFWEYVRILKEVKPKYFILENVASMPKEAKQIITEALGVEPIMINASLVSAQNRKRLFFCGQIRERLSFKDVLCYNCLQDENKGILGKTQNKGTEKILGETPERCEYVQSVSERIQEDRQKGNNEDLLNGVSAHKQEKQRQESQQGNQSEVSTNISEKKQGKTFGVSEEISSVGSGEREDENCGQKTTPNSCEKDEISLSKRNNGDKKENDKGGSLGNTQYETDMFCVSCHKRLNNRPYRSFVSGWDEQPRKSPSIMSQVQFSEAQQNNGRVFDIYQLAIPQPQDKNILLKDILESGESDRLKSYCIDASYYKGANWKQYKEKGRRQLIRVGSLNSGGQGDRIYSPNGKSVGLSALGAGKGAKTGLYHVPHGYKKEKITEEYKYPTLHAQSPSANHLLVDPIIRKLTPIECERLQGLPDNYTEGLSNTQRYKCLGNAFNVDVVAHILSFLV